LETNSKKTILKILFFFFLKDQVDFYASEIQVSIASLLTISSTFNSLFRVLCIFPSRYLYAIGFSPIFIFRWNLPPSFGLQSQTTRLEEKKIKIYKKYIFIFLKINTFKRKKWHFFFSSHKRDCHPPWYLFPKDLYLKNKFFEKKKKFQSKVMIFPKTTFQEKIYQFFLFQSFLIKKKIKKKKILKENFFLIKV